MIRQMSSNARAKKKLRSVNGINRFKNQRNGITMTHGGMSPPPPYTVNDRMVYEQRLRKLYGEVGCDHSGGLYSISYNISLCKWCGVSIRKLLPLTLPPVPTINNVYFY
ncbi:hypothetical protein RclHR1_04730008 [Rhizophagus clarus]|uniref:Uncharacterized protein n=1 Tax=Rhizophagus clarus TaxID=94130 RepID=A0A2Z6SCG8_9GLOM|nr:hypothetical protein RclHR1_04730008 [Rhizophagus clarus]